MDSSTNSPVTGEAGSHVAYSIAVGVVCGLLAIVQSIGIGSLLFSALPAALSSRGAFSRANLDRLHASEPEIAARFHRGIAAMLADRLTRTNRLVQLLAD